MNTAARPASAHVADVGHHGGDAVRLAVDAGVVQGQARVHLVPVHGEHLGRAGQRDQVAADAAAQVGDAAGGTAAEGAARRAAR